MIKLILLIFSGLILVNCDTPTQSTTTYQQADTTKKQSLWTEKQRADMIKEHAKSLIDSLVLDLLISRHQYTQNDSIFRDYLKSEYYPIERQAELKNVNFTISRIAGNQAKDIELILGKPTKTEQITPGGVGTCIKSIYLDGLIEIVYIKDYADWITINNIPSKVTVENQSIYKSVDQFSDYTHVKVFTK